MSESRVSARKRIAQACKPCRSRKVKCDGIYPRCGRCIADATICLFDVSKRNKRLLSPASKARLKISLPPIDGLRTSGSKSTFAEEMPKDITNDRAMRLLKIFFKHIHPIWPILYKPMYGSTDSAELLNVLPIALINAMLSISILLDDSEESHLNGISKHDAAQHFFKQALKSSEEELASTSEEILATKPTIIRCQVFTILALQQHSIAAFSQAGILCGVAAAMAIDLQLHRKSSTGTAIEAEIDSRLWWSIYVLEKMLSWEMSRPMILRAEEADAPFPSVDEADEFEFSSTPSGTDGRLQPTKLRTISSFHTSIRLCIIIEKISRQLYSVTARDVIRNYPIKGQETQLELWAELQRWESEIESSPLRLDLSDNLSSGPVIVTNYVYMHSTTILLHRPFIDFQNSDPHSQFSAADALEICVTSANQICIILEKYSRFLNVLPCDLVFPIFVAANILLRRWRVGESDASLIRPRLEQCIQWLNALGKSWKSAEGRQQVLVESLNANPEALSEENIDGEVDTSVFEAGNVDLNDLSNFTSFAIDNDFDLDYMQWITGLDAE